MLLFMRRQAVGRIAVVQAEADVALEASRPGVEAVALAADEGIERIEEKCPHALERPSLFRALPGQPVEDGNHEAFRFA